MSILTTDPVNLNSMGGGPDAYDSLMYNQNNTNIEELESVTRWSDIITSGIRDFGSVIPFNLQRELFVDYVVMKATVVLPPGISSCGGWLPAMVSGVSWLMGSSSSTEITTSGDSIFQTLAAEVQSVTRRNEMISLMGQCQKNESGVDQEFTAYMLLPLPQSSMCGKLGIDTTILFNNINLKVTLHRESRRAFSRHSGANTLPVQFKSVEFMVRTTKLANQAYSMMNQLQLFPQLSYKYPFTHLDSFVSDVFVGRAYPNICDINLNRFANADIIGIIFYVVRESNKMQNTDGLAPQPYNLETVQDVLVRLNSNIVHNLPQESWKLTNMLLGEHQDSSHYDCGILNDPAHTPSSVKCYPTYLPFTREWAICNVGAEAELANTWRLTNNILSLQFRTPNADGIPCRLYATYLYNSIIQFSQGVSAVYIS